MDEQEWLNTTGPQAMLSFVRGGNRLSERKARLLAVAVCRRLWPLLTDERSRKAVEMAERYADGVATLQELLAAREEGGKAVNLPHIPRGTTTGQPAFTSPTYVALASTIHPNCPARMTIAVASDFAQFLAEGWSLASERREQAVLLRDIFGNPFRPLPSISPAVLAWNDAAVVKMAAAIYEQRSFEDMPLLADALEDAGCTNEDILSHCREQGAVHVRGCWVIDLLLGKE